jgi:hypothetical protein
MPSPRTTPAGLALLTPQLLAEAQADPGRTWAARARCTATDPDLFFPPADALTAPAQQICDNCPVQGHCLAYAVIADEPFGVWGGLGPRERQPLRRYLQRRDQLPFPGSGSGTAA